jgi:hypothetical protein
MLMVKYRRYFQSKNQTQEICSSFGEDSQGQKHSTLTAPGMLYWADLCLKST